MKFGLAAIVMGAAFLLFLPFAGGGENSTPLLAIVGIHFVFTVAELLLSPVGLSVTTPIAQECTSSGVVGSDGMGAHTTHGRGEREARYRASSP